MSLCISVFIFYVLCRVFLSFFIYVCISLVLYVWMYFAMSFFIELFIHVVRVSLFLLPFIIYVCLYMFS